MKTPIQNLILNFISENPRAQMSEIVKALPEIDRSSISSALTRLTYQGKLKRKQGRYGRFEYTLSKGEPVPEIPAVIHSPGKLKLNNAISPAEWQSRFNAAKALLKNGLTRRANYAFLELLDVTSEAKLREKVIYCRNNCGSWPRGDDSSLAGRYVGDHK